MSFTQISLLWVEPCHTMLCHAMLDHRSCGHYHCDDYVNTTHTSSPLCVALPLPFTVWTNVPPSSCQLKCPSSESINVGITISPPHRLHSTVPHPQCMPIILLRNITELAVAYFAQQSSACEVDQLSITRFVSLTYRGAQSYE